MNLDTALTEIAAFLDLDAESLIAHAAADDIGGFHFDANQSKWPGGSLWDCEGRSLYALVRALKPSHALEFGTWHGASATHILSALEANQEGTLVSVDIWEGAGRLVPEKFHSRWLMRYQEAVQYLKADAWGEWGDFVFEDAIHSESEVYAIVKALKPKLRKGAVVVHHDSEHGDDGQQIRRALDRTGVTYKSWLISPSDCGLGIWKYEG